MSVLNKPYFREEEAAFTFLEGIVWPKGPVCPHCGAIGTAYKMTANPEKRIRVGLWKCRECRKQFTVKVGTVFEHARLPLHKALQCAFLLCSSKKGISANQLSRTLEISLKAAWFLAHRVREAMRELHLDQLGGDGMVVEIDEAYIGGREKNKHAWQRRKENVGGRGKQATLALVERGGRVRTHHIADVTGKTLRPILEQQIHEATHVMSDTGGSRPAKMFKKHGMVNHSIGEYVRSEVSTNTVEGYFSILKRGINGVYHHVSEAHLKRYLCEFDFRYNHRVALGVDDFSRTVAALAGITGKRVTYKPAVGD